MACCSTLKAAKCPSGWGNLVDPWAMIERYGADAVRVYLMAASQVGLPKRFDPAAIPKVALGFLTQLKNSYKFFAEYAEDWKAAARRNSSWWTNGS